MPLSEHTSEYTERDKTKIVYVYIILYILTCRAMNMSTFDAHPCCISIYTWKVDCKSNNMTSIAS
jgi:hypothetical protein